jgi:hypothetical protein
MITSWKFLARSKPISMKEHDTGASRNTLPERGVGQPGNGLVFNQSANSRARKAMPLPAGPNSQRGPRKLAKLMPLF